jgi:glyoxylate/hydroxypyruvate reductase
MTSSPLDVPGRIPPPLVLVMPDEGEERWASLLREALPAHEVVTPDTRAGRTPRYAVVGRPKPGLVAALGPVEVLFSVNAGVEALLANPDIPPEMPIVRMADDGLAAGMLEWVLAQVLGWHRNLFDYRAAQQAGRWAPLEEKLASERQVTVLGLGHLGLPVATALAGLGFGVRGWSRTAKATEGVQGFSGMAELAAAVSGADILVNLLPLTPETENLLDGTLLRRMAPGGVLINAGRGRHVVDEAVLALLDEGQLRAAVLDVFRQEPLPPAHSFWRHPGVFLFPHVAAPTHPASAVRAIAANIRRHGNGEPMDGVVDRARGY